MSVLEPSSSSTAYRPLSDENPHDVPAVVIDAYDERFRTYAPVSEVEKGG
jgi:hypothetical protein